LESGEKPNAEDETRGHCRRARGGGAAAPRRRRSGRADHPCRRVGPGRSRRPRPSGCPIRKVRTWHWRRCMKSRGDW